jgi:hypothetical protein
MEILSMGKASRRKRQRTTPDDPQVLGTTSTGEVQAVTGEEVIKQIMSGNTRRVVFNKEGDWTPFERVDDFGEDMVFVNSRYTVFVCEYKWDDGSDLEMNGLHLSIKRNDKDVMNSPDDWRDKMRIKNEIAGDEAEGVELYPAMSRLTDSANQYHLWCIAPGNTFPIGFNDRLVEDDKSFGKKGKRRALEKVVKDMKQQGVKFDPVNDSTHQKIFNALGESGNLNAKQRDCPAWMKAGRSTWRIPGGRSFLVVRLAMKVLRAGFTRWRHSVRG